MANLNSSKLTPSFWKRLWHNDIFSAVVIMGMRGGMLAAKFILTIVIARFMGLEELGIYGLIVGMSGTVQSVLRGGVFTLMSRDAVHQSLPELTHHLRHYGTGVLVVYTLLIPVALAIGLYFDKPLLAILALMVFLTEHLSFDTFVLLNNLQYPKLANFIFSLQSASWIYLFTFLALLFPELRVLEVVLAFWISGGVIALVLTGRLSSRWPWEKTFSKNLEKHWYGEKLKSAFKIYVTDIVWTVNYYMDRFIVSAFLSLEMTGVYVFFSQVITATWNLVNSGVLVVYRPRLIKAYNSFNLSSFNKIFRTALWRTLIATFVLASLAGLTVPFIAQFTNNPTLLEYIPLLWMMLAALMIKVCEMSAVTGLFSMHKDQDNLNLGFMGFVLTAIVGSLGVLTLGVYGMVVNMVVVSLASVIYASLVWKSPGGAPARQYMPKKDKSPQQLQPAQHTANIAAKAESKPNRPHNILIIASTFYPHVFGGGETAAYNKAKLLVKLGYNVSIATLQEKNTPPAWGEMTRDGYRLYRVKTPRQYTLYERTGNFSSAEKIFWHLQDYFGKRNQRLIKDVLDKVNPDHIQIDNLIGIGFNTLSEISRRNIPVAFILHGLDLACFHATMYRNGSACKQQCLQCRPVAALRQSPLEKISRLGFIAPSHSALERAKRFVPATKRALTTVIRNVPDDIPAVLPPRKSADHTRLLFIGRLHPIKGSDFLLSVLDSLSSQFDFHLNILGTGPSEASLKEKYGHKDWVTFNGFVSGHEIAHFIVQSDLSCMPTLVEEIYGIVTAQSLQLGTPVIGSNNGGTAELIRDRVTGMLVPPGDNHAWRHAFTYIFSHPGLLEKWHKNTLTHAGEFDKGAIGKAYEEFIETLIAEPQKLRNAA